MILVGFMVLVWFDSVGFGFRWLHLEFCNYSVASSCALRLAVSPARMYVKTASKLPASFRYLLE
jgi:hypothetical protein